MTTRLNASFLLPSTSPRFNNSEEATNISTPVPEMCQWTERYLQQKHTVGSGHRTIVDLCFQEYMPAVEPFFRRLVCNSKVSLLTLDL